MPVKYEIKAFKKIKAASRQAATDAVLSTAFEIEALSKRDAAVDTGFMRSSHFVEDNTGGPDSNISAEVGVGAEYAIHVDLGTSRMKAQPFFTPAVEQGRKSFEARLRKLFNKAIS